MTQPNRHLKQLVALVKPEIRDGVELLWMISGESRARVMENLLAARVCEELAALDDLVGRVAALAAAAGQTTEEYVEAYADLYGRKTYRPDVAELEATAAAAKGVKAASFRAPA